MTCHWKNFSFLDPHPLSCTPMFYTSVVLVWTPISCEFLTLSVITHLHSKTNTGLVRHVGSRTRFISAAALQPSFLQCLSATLPNLTTLSLNGLLLPLSFCSFLHIHTLRVILRKRSVCRVSGHPAANASQTEISQSYQLFLSNLCCPAYLTLWYFMYYFSSQVCQPPWNGLHWWFFVRTRWDVTPSHLH